MWDGGDDSATGLLFRMMKVFSQVMVVVAAQFWKYTKGAELYAVKE